MDFVRFYVGQREVFGVFWLDGEVVLAGTVHLVFEPGVVVFVGEDLSTAIDSD
jgi:hypothetical protein